MTTAEALINYWFSEAIRVAWFRSTPELDRQIAERWQHHWELARHHHYDHWNDTPHRALALVILFDQIPLNIFRGDERCFASENQAVAVSYQAIDSGFDQQLSQEQLPFLYMPLMHSESLAHQDRSVKLFEQAGLEGNLRYARHHRELIRRFGRFPHRNKILGRTNTDEEREYLNSAEAFTG